MTTARAVYETRFARYALGHVTVRKKGFQDFANHRLFLGRTADRFDTCQVGPDVLTLLSPEECRATGKTWRWHDVACPNWRTERAETVATIRHRATIQSITVETAGGVEVHHYSLAIRLRPREKDPLLAQAYEQVHRQLGVRKVSFHAWFTPDGRLRGTQERMTMLRSYARPGKPASAVVACWDFGVDLSDIAVPEQHDVLRPGDQAPS